MAMVLMGKTGGYLYPTPKYAPVRTISSFMCLPLLTTVMGGLLPEPAREPN